MNLIKNTQFATILENFYLITKSPILMLDTKDNLIIYKGDHNNISLPDCYIKEISNNIKLNNDIKNSKSIKFINLTNKLKLPVIFISKNKLISHYFVFFPFRHKIKESDIDSYSNTAFIPEYCFSYLGELLKIIINDSLINNKETNFMSLNTRKAIEHIHKNFDTNISTDFMADQLNINKCYFCNLFKKETGLTFTNFLKKFRVEKSKELLKNSNLSILDVAISVGFNSQNYYSMSFKKLNNITPLEYRNLL